MHFSKKLSVTLDPQSKAKSFVTLQNSNEKMDLLVSYHSNSIMQYAVDIKKQKKEESKKEQQEVTQTFGEIASHKEPVRGVCMAANDSMFATNSFDSVKVWSVDLFMYSQKNKLEVQCKQSLEEQNVLSMCILPGNKFIVLGTKEGQVMLYDLNQNTIVQRLQSH